MRHFLPALLLLSAVSAIPVEPIDKSTSISTSDATTEQDSPYDSPPFMPENVSDDDFDTEPSTLSLDDREVQAMFAEMNIDPSIFSSTDVDTEPEALTEAPHLAPRDTSKSGVYCQTNHQKIHKYLLEKAETYVYGRGAYLREQSNVDYRQKRGTPGTKEVKCSVIFRPEGSKKAQIRISICGNYDRYLRGDQIGLALQTIALRCPDREGRVAGLYLFGKEQALVKVDNYYMGLDTLVLDWL